MARQIIILDNRITDDGMLEGTVVFWLATPATLVPYAANPAATSRVPDATTAELAAIQDGTVTEMVEQGKIPAGAPVVAVEQGLQAGYAQAQANLNAAAPAKRYIGGTWDGTTWTNMPT